MPEQAYKRCPKCGETKPRGEFYRERKAGDGLQTYCKECTQAHGRAWRAANPGRAEELTKRWRAENRERHVESKKRWERANRKRRIELNKRYRERYPEKHLARKALMYAVRVGKLVKPDRCEGCGEPKTPRQLDGHHEDYSKRLEVEWLCRACHVKRHQEAA